MRSRRDTFFLGILLWEGYWVFGLFVVYVVEFISKWHAGFPEQFGGLGEIARKAGAVERLGEGIGDGTRKEIAVGDSLKGRTRARPERTQPGPVRPCPPGRGVGGTLSGGVVAGHPKGGTLKRNGAVLFPPREAATNAELGESA